MIDHHDPQWPVIRHVHPRLADPERWYLSESRAFFGVRAAQWDAKFGDDLPAYGKAVELAGLRPGDLALDVGCGTGRALPALAAAVGPAGRVIGLDLTPDMLTAARAAGRDELRRRWSWPTRAGCRWPTRRPTRCSPPAWCSTCPTRRPAWPSWPG